MNIQEYFQLDDSRLSFTRQQSSDFAKKVAGDFNPIHDVDSKRFCVPGDLLFSVIIHHYGLRERMIFNFSGMVGDNVRLVLPDCNQEHLAILDENDKKYLAIECAGKISTDAELIRSLTKNYVAFSGQAFPHILLPLMEQHGVMINPERPLVIYESMSFELDRLDVTSIDLELSDKALQVEGKRGNVTLDYEILSGGQRIGRGCKRMVMSGLKPFEKAAMDGLVDVYNQRMLALA
jgi:hypothetical protein